MMLLLLFERPGDYFPSTNHTIYIVNYSLHKRIDKLEAVVKSPVAKNLGRIKNASNKRLGKVAEMNFQSLSVN